MPKRNLPARIHLLTVREVVTAREGDASDGGGLYLRVSPAGASWVFRYTSPTGKRREMGLGACYRQNPQMAGDSLRAAREAAATWRAMLTEVPPRDPIDERQKSKDEARNQEAKRKEASVAAGNTLARVARNYHEKHVEPTLSTAQSSRWIGALEKHVPASVWNKPVTEITPVEFLEFLANLQTRYDDTARRVRSRLDEILEDAADRALIPANPITTLHKKLARRHKPGRDVPRPSLPYSALRVFMHDLRQREGIAARCLEFTILTASRTGEAIGARWDEFNLDTETWTIPAARMKAGEIHTVSLSPQAMDILHNQRALGSPWVFPSPASLEKPLSNMAMLNLLKRMDRADITVHGFRATFSTWANEHDVARPDVVEACLAHREADRIRAAYNRATFTADRRKLLLAWATFVESGSIIAMPGVRAA